MWMIIVRQGTDAKERKEDCWNMRDKDNKILLSQVVLAILVTSFGTPHTVARRLHPDIFTSTGGDKDTHAHTLKDTHRHTETEKQKNTETGTHMQTQTATHTHTDKDTQRHQINLKLNSSA